MRFWGMPEMAGVHALFQPLDILGRHWSGAVWLSAWSQTSAFRFELDAGRSSMQTERPRFSKADAHATADGPEPTTQCISSWRCVPRLLAQPE